MHEALDGQEWIEEVLAASGGIGAGPSAIWVFKLDEYASLDRLFNSSDPVSEAYVDFLSATDEVQDIIREEVIFT